MRGVSEGAVRKAIADGRISTMNDKIDPKIANAQWTQNTNPAYYAEPPAVMSCRAEKRYWDERTMDWVYRVALLKIKYEQRCKELVLREKVEHDLFEIKQVVRNRLGILPSRMAPRLVRKGADEHSARMILEEDIHDCESAIMSMIDRALKEYKCKTTKNS